MNSLPFEGCVCYNYDNKQPKTKKGGYISVSLY